MEVNNSRVDNSTVVKWTELEFFIREWSRGGNPRKTKLRQVTVPESQQLVTGQNSKCFLLAGRGEGVFRVPFSNKISFLK